MRVKFLLTMTAAGFLAAVLAFDLVGFRDTSMLSLIPYVLDILTLVFHEAGRIVSGWVFMNIHDHVDVSGVFRLVEPVPYVGWLLALLVCLAPVFIYHIVSHRFLVGDMSEYLSGPWLRIGLFFLYVIYLVMFFGVSGPVMGEVGGFMTEILIAYVLLARAVSGRVNHTRQGEEFLHFACGFYILFSMIYMISLIIRGIPEEIEKLVILEGLTQTVAQTLAFYGLSVMASQVAWGLLGLTTALLIGPFMPFTAPLWAVMGSMLARVPVGNPLNIFENLNRKPVRPGPIPKPPASPLKNGDIFESNPNDFKGL